MSLLGAQARRDLAKAMLERLSIRAPTAGLRARITADQSVTGRVVEIGRRMGRKSMRTDDPVEPIDTELLEVVIELDAREGLLTGLRVVSGPRRPPGSRRPRHRSLPPT